MASAIVFGLPLLPLALSLDRITNGLTRPFFGWLSDRIGRENTMVIAFTLEGVAMTLWLFTRSNPAAFVLMSGVVLFAWGEIFSLFPSTLTDTYGAKHATTNYGFLYMAQGIGSVLGGPVAALVHDAYGSWMPVFAIIIAMNFATALLAGVALKPMRQRWLGARSARQCGGFASHSRAVVISRLGQLVTGSLPRDRDLGTCRSKQRGQMFGLLR